MGLYVLNLNKTIIVHLAREKCTFLINFFQGIRQSVRNGMPAVGGLASIFPFPARVAVRVGIPSVSEFALKPLIFISWFCINGIAEQFPPSLEETGTIPGG